LDQTWFSGSTLPNGKLKSDGGVFAHTTVVAIRSKLCQCKLRVTAAPWLLLPGALLVTIQTQLLPAFVFVDFRLTTFFYGTHSLFVCFRTN
jgi:hypothetical protein